MKIKKKKKSRRIKLLYIIFAIVIFIIALTVWGLLSSRDIVVNKYKIKYANLPEIFEGYKIVQLSDYHKGIYKNENDTLVDRVSELDPDMILLTGDMIDMDSTDIENITQLCEQLVKISDVIWVKGNHFYKADETLAQQMEEMFIELGIINLTNNFYKVEKEGESINFYGIDDPQKFYDAENLPKEYVQKATLNVIERNLEEVKQKYSETYGFEILVTHRYTNYELFPKYNYSLVFAGHSHGGQVKLVGGVDIIGSQLELFPEINSGYNDIDGMPLIISSGLGTSTINIRMYNPPEIVLVELQLKE